MMMNGLWRRIEPSTEVWRDKDFCFSSYQADNLVSTQSCCCSLPVPIVSSSTSCQLQRAQAPQPTLQPSGSSPRARSTSSVSSRTRYFRVSTRESKVSFWLGEFDGRHDYRGTKNASACHTSWKTKDLIRGMTLSGDGLLIRNTAQ